MRKLTWSIGLMIVCLGIYIGLVIYTQTRPPLTGDLQPRVIFPHLTNVINFNREVTFPSQADLLHLALLQEVSGNAQLVVDDLGIGISQLKPDEYINLQGESQPALSVKLWIRYGSNPVQRTQTRAFIGETLLIGPYWVKLVEVERQWSFANLYSSGRYKVHIAVKNLIELELGKE